jgi:hypothetical protein
MSSSWWRGSQGLNAAGNVAKALTGLLAIDAGYSEAWFNLGVLLADQPGRESEAEGAFRQAVDAGDPDGWCGLAVPLAQQEGRDKEAQEAREKCPRELDIAP